MLFRSSDLLAEFERLTRGMHLGSDFDQMVDNLTDAFSAPGVDAVRTDTAFELYIDLPGVDPANVDLTVDGSTLTVTADRSFEPPEGAEVVHRGRRHGSFNRTFRLTPDLDTDGVHARSDHGVLVVTIPVSSASKPRKIAIDTTD